MAQRLIESWHPAVLRPALDVGGRVPSVSAVLEIEHDGARRTVWSRKHPRDFGVDANAGADAVAKNRSGEARYRQVVAAAHQAADP